MLNEGSSSSVLPSERGTVSGSRASASPPPGCFCPPAQKHGGSRAHGAAVPAAHRAQRAASPESRGPGVMRGHRRRYGAISLKACPSGARRSVAVPGRVRRRWVPGCPPLWARLGGPGRGSLPRVAAPRSKMAADRDTPGHVGRARAAPPPPVPPAAPLFPPRASRARPRCPRAL